jgi:predicted O-methyltransferase YrrM
MIQTSLFDQQYQDQLAIIDPHYIPVMSSATWSYVGPLITYLKPHTVLEIGTAIGFGTLLMARLVSQWWGQIRTFEISYPRYHQALYHFHAYGLSYISSISAYHMDFTRLVYDRFWDKPIDFVRVDGQKSQYPLYMDLVLPYMNDNGICILDDVVMYPQTQHQIYALAHRYGYGCQCVGLSDGDGVFVISKVVF